MWMMLVCMLVLAPLGGALDYANLELFREGFDPANLEILRNVGDNIRLPFRTDTNRYSDGSTSNVAYTGTSPAFPQYKGFLASPEGRHEGYLNYSQSCVDQGIAKYGAGDAEKEEARKELVEQYTADELQNLERPSKTFTVFASIKWNPSNFCIQKDEDYFIEVVGEQMWQDGGILVGPEGYESYYDAVSNCFVALGRCRSHLRKKRRVVAPWMSLACSVGEFVRPLGETDPTDLSLKINYLPLDEAVLQETIFSVGRSVALTKVPHTGQLICFANDAHLNYWNNVGEIQVKVTRTSWPPSSDLYYEALRYPACDSALMVYRHQGYYNENGEFTYEDSSGDILEGKCNPDGGGAGWDPLNVKQTETRYGSAVDQSFYLPQVRERFFDRPNYITKGALSEYESIF